MTYERRGRVAIEWGCDRLRDINEIDRLGVEHAVAVNEMVHGQGSVEQPVDGRAPLRSLRRRDDPAVRPDRRLEVGPRGTGVGGGGSRRRVEPALAPAARQPERGDQRADGCNPGEAQVGQGRQFSHSSIERTIADRTREATAWPNPATSVEFIIVVLPRS